MIITIEQVNYLVLLKKYPQAEDAVNPHSLRVSRQFAEYMLTTVVRNISGLVKNKTLKERLKGIGKEMAVAASAHLPQGWDNDDICPPWKWPFPPRHRSPVDPSPVPWSTYLPFVDPSPEPWRTSSAEQIVLADLLMSLASITIEPKFSVQLKDVASNIVKGEINNLTKEFGEANVGG